MYYSSDAEDTALAARCVAGDAAASEPLLERYQRLLFCVAFRMLAVLPPLVLLVFNHSERATREWVGAGLDLDVDLLQLVLSEHFANTRMGAYLRDLKQHFSEPVVVDMLCLLRIELELSAQARDCLAELNYLRASIGPTGLRALRPLGVTSHHDDWHRHLLMQPRRPAAR